MTPAEYWKAQSDQAYDEGVSVGLRFRAMPLPAALPVESEPRRKGDVFLRTREWKAVRERFIAKAEQRCVTCGGVDRLCVDHVLARQRHPELALTEANLQMLCWQCNMRKANRLA